jgi:hypothetical protein
MSERVVVRRVWFFGSITAALAVGALYLSANGKAEEAPWVALGAGIGALDLRRQGVVRPKPS